MAMFLLVEFKKWKALAVVSEEDITPSKVQLIHGINIGESVLVKWNEGKSGGNYFEATVVAKGDNFDELERSKKLLLQKPKESKIIMNGKRTKRKTNYVSTSDDDSITTPTKVMSGKPKAFKSKISSKSEATKITKASLGISDNSISDEEYMESSILEELKQLKIELQNSKVEVEKLKIENEKLKRDNKEAYVSLLQLANKMMENLKSLPAANNSGIALSKSYQEAKNSNEASPWDNYFTPKRKRIELEPTVDIEPEMSEQIHLGSDEKNTQLKWNKSSDKVVDLCGYKVFLPADCLQKILYISKTGSQMARNLAKAIFTEETLGTCSVYGGPSKGPLGKQSKIRAALHGDAVKAIIEYTLEKGKKENWPDRKKHIVHTLGSLLSASRPKCKS